MDSKTFDFICDNFKGERREKALRVMSKKATREETQDWFKKFYTSQLVHGKFQIRKILRCINDQRDDKRLLRRNKWRLDEGEYELRITEIDDFISRCKDTIAELGELIIDTLSLSNKYMTIKEFSQIINANPVVVENAVKEHIEQEGKEPSLLDIVFVYHGEDHNFKADFIDKGEETPLFTAIEFAFMNKLKTNREFKKKTNEGLNKFFPELMENSVRVYTDIEGRVIGVEKNKKELN